MYVYARHRSALRPMLYERVYWKDVLPWVRAQSIFIADPDVGLWMKPHLDRTYINLFGPIGDLADVEPMLTGLSPRIPSWAHDRPIWRLTTNALGIRNDEVNPIKPPSTFRIIVIGDSWTVGANLDVEQTFVRRLAGLLGDGFRGGRVEVINYGVMGGRAETGRRLMDRVLRLAPDVLVIAYAQNDENDVARAGVAASPRGRHTFRAGLADGWPYVLDHFESYKLLQYVRTRQRGAIETSLRRNLTVSTRMGETDMRPPCLNPRATATPYRNAIESLVVASLNQHVDVLLLYNNLPNFASHCTLVALSEIARIHGVPLVDSSALLAAKRRELLAEAERARDLVPIPSETRSGSGYATVILRVDMIGHAGRPSVTGNTLAVGLLAPNEVMLFDDGTHGDQRPNDGVWSLAVDVGVPHDWSTSTRTVRRTRGPASKITSRGCSPCRPEIPDAPSTHPSQSSAACRFYRIPRIPMRSARASSRRRSPRPCAADRAGYASSPAADQRRRPSPGSLLAHAEPALRAPSTAQRPLDRPGTRARAREPRVRRSPSPRPNSHYADALLALLADASNALVVRRRGPLTSVHGLFDAHQRQAEPRHAGVAGVTRFTPSRQRRSRRPPAPAGAPRC